MAVATAAVLRGTVFSMMGERSPFGFFTIAILIAAWYGGFWPGIFSLFLSVFTGLYLFMPPSVAATDQGVLMLTVFGLNGVLIAVVCESLLSSKVKAEKALTQMREAQRQLEKSEEKFRNLANSAPVLIWICDTAKLCTWVNRPWLEFTGRTMEEELGLVWGKGIHPDDLDRCLKIFTENFEARHAFEMDYRLRRHDEHYRWVVDRCIPFFDGNEEFIGFMGGCIDIHDRKMAEDNSEALLKLEQHARAEAERVARLKDDFLSTVSHEMRTPLTAMLGWVTLLRKGGLPPDTVTQALETIERNARAQAKLIDDLLDMSRILSGHLLLDIQRIRSIDIVEASINSLEPAASAKSIRFERDFDPKAGELWGDPIRLQQIIGNLLNNAIKFTPEGGVVTVGIKRGDCQIEIFVRDNGEGIEADFLPHVFERFRQQNASTTRHHQGLGLGLSIVRQLVILHKGKVRVESPGPKMGSTFTVTFPVAESPSIRHDEKPVLGIEAWRNAIKTLPTLLGTKILVVDDDKDTREWLRAVLAQNGASVRTADSAQHALNTIDDRIPDVLVSDIGMPGMDGNELIKSIRSRQPRDGGNIPALALTAFARDEDHQLAIQSGFQLHLAKPVEPTVLVTVIAGLAKR